MRRIVLGERSHAGIGNEDSEQCGALQGGWRHRHGDTGRNGAVRGASENRAMRRTAGAFAYSIARGGRRMPIASVGHRVIDASTQGRGISQSRTLDDGCQHQRDGEKATLHPKSVPQLLRLASGPRSRNGRPLL